MNFLGMCPPKKWMMNNSLKEEWSLKKRELVGHKRTKQKEKNEIIDFLTCEAFRRWFSKDGV
jgi:hypothetical protein